MIDTVRADLDAGTAARSVVSNATEVENMFRDIIEPSMRIGSRKPFALPLSIAAHVILVAVLLLVPLMAPGMLPMPAAALMAFVSRDVALPPSLQPAQQQPVAETKRVVDVHPYTAPLEAPSAITPESTVEPTATLVGPVEDAGNERGGVAEDLVPPAPPDPPSAPVAPVPVGGKIKPPTKIKDVRPVYPGIAQAARVEGLVIIETTISPTGRVMDAKLLRSIPLLDAAALDAVRQWEFTPTLLNGNPVPVVMTVTVNFTLR
jgi:periplasmic protein TonB